MAGGNYYAELEFDEPSKKEEKKQKTQAVLNQQKNSAKGKIGKETKEPSHHFEPTVDSSRPQKRIFDKQSGTGRGFVFSLFNIFQ